MATKQITHLSQSFFIDKPCFVTSVDLFFSSRDDSIPFKFNIRRNQEGRPTNEILNFSSMVVPSANVLFSDDANTATRLNFEAPVFLEVGEYSMNLGSDSRSYNVYVAELNETDITTDRKITQQPALGTFYQTETLKSFTPSTFQDLKFNLYRAKFYTNVTSTVNLVPETGIREDSSFLGELDVYPFELFKDRTTMKVYQFNHGYTNGSFVKFSSVANTMSNISSYLSDVSKLDGYDSKIDAGNIFGLDGNVFHEVFEVSNVKLNSYTVDLGTGRFPVINDTRFRFGGIQSTIPAQINYNSILPRISTYKTGNVVINHKVKTFKSSDYLQDPIFLSLANLTDNEFSEERTIASISNIEHKTSNVEPFHYRIEMFSKNDRVSPMIDSKQMGVFLKRNLVDNTNYSATVLEHEKTLVSNIGSQNGLHGGPAAELHKANIYLASGNFGTINLSNVSDMSNANAFINGCILNVQANTSATDGSGFNNSGLYRVVDVLAGPSANINIKVAKISGNIELDTSNNNVYSIVHSNDFIAEEAAVGGTTYSKYITREVTFNNPSTGIRVIFDASVPLNSNLDLYFKTKLAGDSTKFSDIEYQKVTDFTIPNSLDGSFVEFEKQINNINAFNSITFKIVFNANNTQNVPRIKNFRLIAVS